MPNSLKMGKLIPKDIAPNVTPVNMSTTHSPIHIGFMLLDARPVNKKKPPFAIM